MLPARTFSPVGVLCRRWQNVMVTLNTDFLHCFKRNQHCQCFDHDNAKSLYCPETKEAYHKRKLLPEPSFAAASQKEKKNNYLDYPSFPNPRSWRIQFWFLNSHILYFITQPVNKVSELNEIIWQTLLYLLIEEF